MIAVLGLNIGLSTWESWVARRTDCDLLRADARHTLSDVFVTLAVIAGWQAAAMGYFWLDALTSCIVAGLIIWLAYGLFRRSIPVLVDQSMLEPEDVRAVIDSVPGVRATRRVRSLRSGAHARVDVVVCVDPELKTSAAHRIADEIERALADRFKATDVSVHMEPHCTSPKGRP